MNNCQYISIHSYRGGTGKSNITANIAVLMAEKGLKIGLVDMDMQSPGIHALFGFDSESFKYCLNDYLWSKCEISEAAYNLKHKLVKPVSGELFLLPSSILPGDIARIINDGYDVDRLNDGLTGFAENFNLDFILIDTHPGLSEETLLSISLSDRLLILLRPDRQDYQGTSVTIKVASQLSVPKMSLCVNKTPDNLPEKELKQKIEDAYSCPVDEVLYHSDDMMELASNGIFVQLFPENKFSVKLRNLTGKILL